MNTSKNDKQRKLQCDKRELSNVKFTNPEEAANLLFHKSQPTTMSETLMTTLYFQALKTSTGYNKGMEAWRWNR
jgi:hypothetical protein